MHCACVSLPPAPTILTILGLSTIRCPASLWSVVWLCQQHCGAGGGSLGRGAGALAWFWEEVGPFVVWCKVAQGAWEQGSSHDDEALLDSHAPPCVVPSRHSPLPPSASPCVHWLAPVHMRGHLRISVIVLLVLAAPSEAGLAPCLRLLTGWRYKPLHQRVFRARFRHIATVSCAQSYVSQQASICARGGCGSVRPTSDVSLELLPRPGFGHSALQL